MNLRKARGFEQYARHSDGAGFCVVDGAWRILNGSLGEQTATGGM